MTGPGDREPSVRLSDEELRDVLARAEEIERATRHGAQWSAERAAVIAAGEEIGLSRAAIERALLERVDLPATPPRVGQLVWARSADDKFYVAEVLAVGGDDTALRVRFLRGSEHDVSADEVRPCGFLPGERVSCNWPAWGTWTCTVVAYDAARQRVKLSDGWGSARTFPVSEVWISPKPETRLARSRFVVALGAGAALGALLGSIITALLL